MTSSRTNNRQRMLSQRMLSLINNCCVNHCRTITAGCWLPQRLASRRAVECRQFERTAHLLGLLIVVAPLLAGCALPGQTARNQATRNQALDGPTPLQSQPQSQPLAAQQQPVPGQVGSMTGAVQQVAYHGGMTQASGYQSHDQGHYQGHANCDPCNTPQYSQQPQQCTAGCCGTAAPIYPTMPPMSQFGIDPQEFLCDGGDQRPNAVYTKQDNLIGVNLEDTVAKYETPDGNIQITPSNRVCVYAPRFASVRRINGAVTGELATGPVAYERATSPNDVLAEQPNRGLMAPVGPELNTLAKGPDGLRARDLGVPIDMVQGPIMTGEILAALVNLSVINTGVLRDADKPWLAKGADAAVEWSDGLSPVVMVDNIRAAEATRDVAAQGLTTYDLPNGRLRVIKVADRNAAEVGEIITFVLRVDNVGEGPLDQVELTDNLTTRLEYVEDSQTSSKGAVFSTEANEGGSLRLTWKFTDDFEVGEGAIIRFRCRVR